MKKKKLKFCVLTGDCRKVLRDLPANSIDAIVCDPPYGLATHTTEDIEAALTSWLSRKRHKTKKKGFMGKQWDGFVPGPETWRACRRVLKPGGYVLAFAGTRTMDLMGIAIRLAGFELRDTMQHLHGDCPWVLGWVQGQGFPKNMNIGKAIDKKLKKKRKVVGKRKHPTLVDTSKVEEQANAAHGSNTWAREWDITDPASKEAIRYHNYGTNLKPSIEPIILARKPLDGTVAANVLKWGTGGLNIDGCRVGYQSEADKVSATPQGKCTAKSGALAGSLQHDGERSEFDRPEQKGRWPSNVLMSHSPGCRCVGTKRVKGDGRGEGKGSRPGGFHNVGHDKGTKEPNARVYGDPDGTETTEQWECVDGCPVKMLDEQAGTRTSGTLSPSNNVKATTGWSGGSQADRVKNTFTANSGSASRFFKNIPPPEIVSVPSGTYVGLCRRCDSDEGGLWTRVDPDDPHCDVCGRRVKTVQEQMTYMSAELFYSMPQNHVVPAQPTSRFFYCSKASRRERELGLHDFPGRNVNDGRATSIDNPYQRGDSVRHNTHTTVKPVDLMRYLVRLVTPPDGVVLDPFAGSGTTGIACMLEGFDFFGVEKEEEYAEIARHRIRFARRHPKAFRVKTHKAKPDKPKKPKQTLWDY